MKSRHIFLFGLFLSILLIHSLARSDNRGNFQLVILRQGLHELNLSEDGTKAQATLMAQDLKNPLFSVGLTQIDHYNWDKQAITLNSETSNLLNQALFDSKDLYERERLIESEVIRGLNNHAFVVLVDDRPLYGGIFLDASSEMALKYPVARISSNNQKIEITLLPIQVPFVKSDPVDKHGGLREAEVPQSSQGGIQNNKDFFKEVVESFALSEDAIRFRRLIRSETIHTAIERADKLKN